MLVETPLLRFTCQTSAMFVEDAIMLTKNRAELCVENLLVFQETTFQSPALPSYLSALHTREPQPLIGFFAGM